MKNINSEIQILNFTKKEFAFEIMWPPEVLFILYFIYAQEMLHVNYSLSGLRVYSKGTTLTITVVPVTTLILLNHSNFLSVKGGLNLS